VTESRPFASAAGAAIAATHAATARSLIFPLRPMRSHKSRAARPGIRRSRRADNCNRLPSYARTRTGIEPCCLRHRSRMTPEGGLRRST
jgi:hypothetical protein